MTSGPSDRYEVRPGLFAHACGAAWIEGSRTMLVADLHLGYAWAQRRRGELGPIAQGVAETPLFAALDALMPARLVVLGDLVHAPRPSAAEFAEISETLHQLRRRAELILVAGNHDRGAARDFGLALAPHWEEDGVLATHGDRPFATGGRFCLYGHWHPTVLLKDAAGAGTRYRVFLSSPSALVLPAFSPFSRGLDVRRGLPPDLQAALGGGPAHLIATSGRSVRRLPHALQRNTSSR